MTLAQRYYVQNVGAAASVLALANYTGLAAETFYFTISLPGTMRTAPTVVLIGTYTMTNAGTPTLKSSLGSFVVSFTGTAIGTSSIVNPANGGYSATAEL